MKISSNRMTPALRNLPFPLVIMCLVSIRGYCLQPTASRATGTPPDGHLSDDDYDDYDDTVAPPIGTVSPFQRCDYHPCRENQLSCDSLKASTGCSCPGFTLYSELPHAPELKSVSWNGSGVVVRWCAPYSYITSYVVTVEGQEKLNATQDQRSCVLGTIDHEVKVCVLAVNDTGRSDRSCMKYQPKDNRLRLTAGLVAGGVGLLLLLLLVALLWRRRGQKKEETRSV